MPQTIAIRGFGDVELPDDLWLDLRAFSAASGQKIPDVIAAAIERFFALPEVERAALVTQALERKAGDS
jgi:hypothetical protein